MTGCQDDKNRARFCVLCVCVTGRQRFTGTTRTIRSAWHRVLRTKGRPTLLLMLLICDCFLPLPFGLDLQGSVGQHGPPGPPGPPGEGIQGPKVGNKMTKHSRKQTLTGGGLQTQNLTFGPLLEVAIFMNFWSSPSGGARLSGSNGSSGSPRRQSAWREGADGGFTVSGT